MTPLAEILHEEIEKNGPISFHRFMEAALYEPKYGYYRRPERDPFGKQGDFFTAEQLQPVFGILIAARIRLLYQEMGELAFRSVTARDCCAPVESTEFSVIVCLSLPSRWAL